MSAPARNYSFALILTPIIFAILFLVACIILNWPLWERSFFSDKSPISWLSSAFIFANAFVVLKLLVDRNISLPLGLWLFCSMLYMSLDEQFMYHEWWKYSCKSWFSLCQFSLVREAPIICVGFFGFITLILLIKTLPQKSVITLFSIAISFGIFAVIVDQTSYIETLSDFEEGFEVLAEAFFLSGLLAIEKKHAASY